MAGRFEARGRSRLSQTRRLALAACGAAAMLAGCAEGEFPDEVISRPSIGVDFDPAEVYCPVSQQPSQAFC